MSSSHTHLRDIPHRLGLHLHPDHYLQHNKDDYSKFPISPLGGNRPFPIPVSSDSSTSTSTSDDDERKSESRARERVKRIKEKVRHRSRSRSRSRKRRNSTNTSDLGGVRLTIGEDDQRREGKGTQEGDIDRNGSSSSPNSNTSPQITRTPATPTPSEGSISTTASIRRSKTQPSVRPKSSLSKSHASLMPVPMLQESAFSSLNSALRRGPETGSIFKDDSDNNHYPPIEMPPYPATPDFVDGDDYLSSTTTTNSSISSKDSVNSSPRTTTDLSPITPSFAPMTQKKSTHRRGPKSFTDLSTSLPSPPPGVFEIDSSRELPRRRSFSLPTPLPHATEDPLTLLATITTTFLIDDSPSMTLETRWSDTINALCTIAETASRYSSSGISIRFLNQTGKDRFGITGRNQVEEMFKDIKPVQSGGSTPIGGRLDEILRDYLDSYRRWRRRYKKEIRKREREKEDGSHHRHRHRHRHGRTDDSDNTNNVDNNNKREARTLPERPKPLSIIVLTDGEATDDPEPVIVSVARELDRLNAPLIQVGVQMFQVGSDEDVRRFLKELDDDLVRSYGVRDMVDTVWFGKVGAKTGRLTAEVIMKTLAGGWNRRVDGGVLEEG